MAPDADSYAAATNHHVRGVSATSDRSSSVCPDATAQLIGGYAAQWGFPADAVTAWRTSAARRASGDRYYGTHVFTPADIGHIHLEFQVSHHVRERDFVIAALFSWHTPAA